MQYQQILFEVDSGVATIRLNRPQAMNSMSSNLLLELSNAFNQVKSNTSIQVVIITGEGDRAFCAGLDLKELSEGTDQFLERLDSCDIIESVQNCGCPVIGAVNGCAITGGFELALACDFLIASDTAKFADTHARVGLVPSWGMSQKLPRLIGISRAKELSLTGRFISAEEALSWGLVNHVVPASELMDKARMLADAMLSNDARAMSSIRDTMDYGWQHDLQSGLAYEAKVFKEFTAVMARDTVANNRQRVQEQGRSQNKQ
ncbi:MAG: enoyl-CoA hydratase [Candidatus Pelagadaptatus aseana]|uniref:enoyl-CoA hydratase n=1 Tax=Candidatus Pelagadaptatus aseana TaxID=3120508 RepID=UPI0039B2599D